MSRSTVYVLDASMEGKREVEYRSNDNTQIINNNDIDKSFQNGLFYRINNFRTNKSITLNIFSLNRINPLPSSSFNNYAVYIEQLFNDELVNNDNEDRVFNLLGDESDDDLPPMSDLDDDENKNNTSVSISNEIITDTNINNSNNDEITEEQIINYCNKYYEQFSKKMIKMIEALPINSRELKEDTMNGNNSIYQALREDNLINKINTIKTKYTKEALDIYNKRVDDAKKYNRKFNLIPKHLYDALYSADLECPCCLENNLPKEKFNMTCCGHCICSECLYNLPNNKCPTCKKLIE
jgi:hypothetical protein